MSNPATPENPLELQIQPSAVPGMHRPGHSALETEDVALHDEAAHDAALRDSALRVPR